MDKGDEIEGKCKFVSSFVVHIRCKQCLVMKSQLAIEEEKKGRKGTHYSKLLQHCYNIVIALFKHSSDMLFLLGSFFGGLGVCVCCVRMCVKVGRCFLSLYQYSPLCAVLCNAPLSHSFSVT